MTKYCENYKTCLYYGQTIYNGKCEACIHYEHRRIDNYKRAPEELIAKRKEEEYRIIENATISDRIKLEISDEFRKTFSLAKKCLYPNHNNPALRSVLATDNYLLASNSYVLVKLKSNVPDVLKNKCIVRLENECAGIYEGKFPDWKSVFEKCVNHNSIPYKDVTLSAYSKDLVFKTEAGKYYWGPEYNYILHPEGKIVVNREFLDLMREVLSGDITMFYSKTDSLSPVLFTGNNGEMVIIPVRTSTSQDQN